jgi:hypothetical protein
VARDLGPHDVTAELEHAARSGEQR